VVSQLRGRWLVVYHLPSSRLCTPTSQNLPRHYTRRHIARSGTVPLRSWPSDVQQNTIVVCLVIVDRLHHKDIGRSWTDCPQDTPYRARLFIHAKNPHLVESKWVRSHLVDVTFNPNWNSVEVVQATLSMMQSALQYGAAETTGKDASEGGCRGECGRFVYCTETCLPLCTLAEVGTALYERDCSWLSAYHTAASFGAVGKEVVPPKVRWCRLLHVLSCCVCALATIPCLGYLTIDFYTVGGVEEPAWLDCGEPETCS
jgi:hypothetical protein